MSKNSGAAKKTSKKLKNPVKAASKVKKTVARAAKKTARKPSKLVARKTVAKKPMNSKAKIAANYKPAMRMMPQAVAKPAMMARPIAPMPASAKPIMASMPQSFKVGHYVVYPTHGVGKILAEESQKVGEIELRLFVIAFEKDKMTLRVPVTRAAAAGLRNISSMAEIEKAFATLRGRARTSRGMWSRRAQEYEAKINSGSLMSVAEVVRDLHKNVDQSERSYSERMIYESALGRLVGELAAAHKTDSKTATDKLMGVLKAQVAA